MNLLGVQYVYRWSICVYNNNADCSSSSMFSWWFHFSYLSLSTMV